MKDGMIGMEQIPSSAVGIMAGPRCEAFHYSLTIMTIGEERSLMAKFRCIQCKKEFEEEANAATKRCPSCFSRYLELVSGEMKRGKSWSAKSFSVK